MRCRGPLVCALVAATARAADWPEKYLGAKGDQYNDALRTYSQKLVDLGIPSQEIDAMGFTLLPSQSTSGPAGLVVQ